MKSTIFNIVFVPLFLCIVKSQCAKLEELETERELRQLIKVRLHGEPLKLAEDYVDAEKAISFSPDSKHLAVAFNPGPVLIYDITTEKAKRLDRELEKMREERKNKEAK